MYECVWECVWMCWFSIEMNVIQYVKVPLCPSKDGNTKSVQKEKTQHQMSLTVPGIVNIILKCYHQLTAYFLHKYMHTYIRMNYIRAYTYPIHNTRLCHLVLVPLWESQYFFVVVVVKISMLFLLFVVGIRLGFFRQKTTVNIKVRGRVGLLFIIFAIRRAHGHSVEKSIYRVVFGWSFGCRY